MNFYVLSHPVCDLLPQLQETNLWPLGEGEGGAAGK